MHRRGRQGSQGLAGSFEVSCARMCMLANTTASKHRSATCDASDLQVSGDQCCHTRRELHYLSASPAKELPAPRPQAPTLRLGYERIRGMLPQDALVNL